MGTRNLLRGFIIFLVFLALLGLSSKASAQSPLGVTSLIVKMVQGLTAEDQVAVIASNAGTEISSIPKLRLHVIEVPTDALATVLQNYRNDPRVERVEENIVRKSEGVSMDPYFGSQWALPKIGWDLVYGSVIPLGTATVAVLDTGVDASHPDLAGKIVGGTSILNGSDWATDPNGHGTWLSGIIAAVTNNSIGIAGIGYQGVRIMPVTVLDAAGMGQDADIINGIIWAVDNGAEVILMGFSNPGFSTNLQDAIDYAWQNGVVLVAATGNDGLGDLTYPAGDRGVIGVSSTDVSDNLAGFSNYGQAVFLAAPGVNIEATDTNDSYSAITGTSSSAAIVAGVAAFMKANDPTLTNGIIVGRIARTADPAGTQDQTGNGRINMARALEDTGTDFIKPAGAPGGGPYVGPYVAAALGVTSISPIFGSALGGTSVTITGSGFTSGQAPFAVTFGGVPATSVTRVDNTHLTATTPAHAAGAVDVNVRDKGGAPGVTLTNGFTYNKVNQTITFGALASKTYGDADFTVSATASSGLSVTFSSQTPGTCTVSASTVHIVAAGNCTIRASQAGDTAYNAAPDVEQSFTINRANATIVVTPYSVTYDAGAHTATGTATGVKGESLSGLDLSHTTHTNAGTYSSDYWSFTDVTGNYDNVPNTTITDSIAKANATIVVTPYSVTYDGNSHTAIGTATGVKGESLSGLNLSGTTHTNAGDYASDAWAFTDSTGNYNNANGTVHDQIAKANATINVTGYTGIYDGAAHGASGTAAGVGGVDLSAALNLGTSFTDVPGGTAHWTFSGGTNYNDASGDVAIVINKADAIIVVTPYSVTYDGNPHTATGTATGAGGLDLSASLNLAGTTHTNAGTYNNDPWSFAGGTNYNDASGTVNDSIGKADAACTVNGYTGVYNGAAHGATGSCTGVGGVDLSGSLNLGATFTDVPGGTAHWTFTGGTNYNDASGDVAIVINKADQTIDFGTLQDKTAGDAPFAISASASSGLDVSFSSLSSSVCTVLGNTVTLTNLAGLCTIQASQGGNGNYNSATPVNRSFTVNPGVATAFSVVGLTSTTAGDAFDLTVTARDLYNNTATGYTGTVHFTSGDGQAVLPGDATLDNGTKTFSVILKTSGTQYIVATDTVTSSITGESAPIEVDPSVATLLSVSAPASATAGEAINVAVTAQDAYNNTATGYAGTVHLTSTDGKAVLPADSTLTDGTQIFSVTLKTSGTWYIDATDTVDNSITGESGSIKVIAGVAKKLSVVASKSSVSAFEAFDVTVTAFDDYDNIATGYLGTVHFTSTDGLAELPPNYLFTTGASGDNGVHMFTGVVLKTGGTQTITATDTSDGSIAGTSGDITVNKVNATIDVTGYTGTYDAVAHGASGTATGVGGVDLSGSLNLGVKFTDVPGGTAHWTFSGGASYNDASGDVAIVINKAAATINVTPYSVIYDGNPHTATGSATGVKGEDLSGWLNLSGTTHTNAGDYPSDTWTFSGGTNYNNANGRLNDKINKAEQTINWSAPADIVYGAALNGTQLNATVLVPGASPAGDLTYEPIAGTILSAGANQNLKVTAAATSNYNEATKLVQINVSKATPTINVTGGPFTYNGNTQPATAAAIGVSGADVSASGSFSFIYNPGGANTPVDAGTYAVVVSFTSTNSNYTDATGTGSITINIGNVLAGIVTTDADFKHVDGMDVLFTKEGKTTVTRLKNTNPGTFQFHLTMQNETGVIIDSAMGNTATAIIEVPDLTNCGNVSCAPAAGLDKPAFVLKGNKPVHAHPDDKTDEDMKIIVEYMTYTGYQANGNSCGTNITAGYTTALPGDEAPKCIRVTGFAIPKKHKATVHVHFEFRPKDTPGWNANSQIWFRAQFPFKSKLFVTSSMPSPIVKTSTQTYGFVAAGQKVTAVGGFVFDQYGYAPADPLQVRIFNPTSTPVDACTSTVALAEDKVQPDGFWFLWKQGGDQGYTNPVNLPSGVQYKIALCDGTSNTLIEMRQLKSKLGNQEFDEEDFILP